MHKIVIVLSVLFALICLSACGASAKRQEDVAKCLERCHLETMQCLEASTCTDVDGQMIPCERECDEQRVNCEAEC